jgi:hypothetical protein
VLQAQDLQAPRAQVVIELTDQPHKNDDRSGVLGIDGRIFYCAVNEADIERLIGHEDVVVWFNHV